MKFIKKTIIFIIILLIITIIIITCQGYNMYKKTLEQIPLEEKVAEIRGKEEFTTMEELPKTYINAVIAVEDHRFYTHNGIDIIGIGRAIMSDIKTKEFREGGSTITQQISKNIYFNQNKNIVRKVAETLMALKIEKEYSKNEIFELYINTSYFGDGYYSVKEASRGYFNKEPIEMNDYESTLLAGIPNAPSIYAPTKNLDLAEQRQKQVINKMVKYGYLLEVEAEQIKKESNIY